jgi:hypothetical protein
VPLLDNFGKPVTLTVTNNGQYTFKSTVAVGGNPNLGFYLFVPAVPIYIPVLQSVYPNGPSEPTGQFTFTVGPAQGASISTNGIGLVLNGVAINSGLSFTPAGGGSWTVNYTIQSNALYAVVINVTNMSGLTLAYSESFDTFNLNNYHWMAADYDFSTNNGSAGYGVITGGTGGSAGNGWTGGLFIDNPVPTGDTNAPTDQLFQFQTNSYFGFPTGLYPSGDPAGDGAVAQQSIDIYWLTNTTQDPGLLISNSVYRGASAGANVGNSGDGGDGVGTQVASDSFLLPEFVSARTNIFPGASSADANICEFNIGYFYANDWLNYTRTYPTGTFNVWGRLADGGTAFNGCTLSLVTSGVGTSNQTTQVLGSFSDSSPAGWQTYHWIPLLDTNGNNVVVQLGGKATLRLTAPTNASPSGGGLNPLFFMLAPAPLQSFNISAALVGGNIQISIPTQAGHNFTLWHAGGLPAASWTQVGGTIVGDGTVHVVSQSLTNNQGYYHVIAQ